MSVGKLPPPRMVPVTFGACTGWLHPAAGKHGVLLCGAPNHEILPLYQSWHALATMIADAGLPRLRFDYHGTGDSLGDDRQPGRVDAWLQSIHAAAQFLREELGFQTLDIVGIRLGATLAALTATEIGAERLVTVAPVVSGRTYIREAQARSKMLSGMWRLGEASAARGDIANDGLLLTKETAIDIASLDLTCVTAKPAAEVLLVGENSTLVHKLQKAYEAADCRVTCKDFTGFAALMDSATLAQIPLDDWEVVVSYLAKGREAGSNLPVLPRGFALQATSFREERMIFGHNDRLAGVLCRPLAQTPVATILFLNTGGNPHFGWGRMSVEHARALAARGIASLRLDIAGLGDAAPLAGSPRAALYRKESVADVREALDFWSDAAFPISRLSAIVAAPGWHSMPDMPIRAFAVFSSSTCNVSSGRAKKTWKH